MLVPVPEEEHGKAREADRQLRKRARRAGHIQPLAIFAAKRQKIGHQVSQLALSTWDSLRQSAEIPVNRLDRRPLPPPKRLRAKTMLDQIAGEWTRA